MSKPPQSERAGGFTLLELLTALVVLGFLVVGLAQGLRFGVQAFGHQSQVLSAESELDATDRTLRRLIEQMEPGGRGVAEIVGDAKTLRFSTEMPAPAEASGTRRVWALLKVDRANRLVLQWSPNRHAQPLGPPPAPAETVLVERVDHLDLAYALPPGAGSGWVSSWKSVTPPRLVRIHIGFARGDVRRWPDILAAPMRDQTA
jgi:general secretion pathway protein J